MRGSFFFVVANYTKIKHFHSTQSYSQLITTTKKNLIQSIFYLGFFGFYWALRCLDVICDVHRPIELIRLNNNQFIELMESYKETAETQKKKNREKTSVICKHHREEMRKLSSNPISFG